MTFFKKCPLKKASGKITEKEAEKESKPVKHSDLIIILFYSQYILALQHYDQSANCRRI
jgi:hypothetical protein